MPVQNSERSFVGIAKEATKGTGVAPTFYVPVQLSKLKPTPVMQPLNDQAIRGSLAKTYGHQIGRKYATFDLGGPVFADAIGWFIAGILGDVVTTGASAPFTHTIALKNATAIGADAQPTAFTITDFYGANVAQFPGLQVSDFTLNFSSDGLLEWDAKLTGFPETTPSLPTPAWTTIIPTPVWIGTVNIGGGSVVNNISGTLNMKRPVVPIFGIANTQSPYAIFLGALEVTGTLTFVMEADTEMIRYLTDTQPILVFNWSQGAGASATQLQFTLTKGDYIAGAVDRSGEFVKIVISFQGLGNTTDAGASAGYSPIKFVLQNALPSGTYQ